MNMTAQPQAKPAPTPSFTPVRTNLLQRKCACGGTPGADGECVECRGKRLQRRATHQAGPDTVPPIVHEVLRSLGQPLDPATRTFMESRFGHDFSRVRVHTDAQAAESARAVNALAYTVGQDVVFGAGKYAAGTVTGQRLLAHELTHTVQQGNRPRHGAAELETTGPKDAAERQADYATEAISEARPFTVTPDATRIARQAPAGVSTTDYEEKFRELGGLWMKVLLEKLDTLSREELKDLREHSEEASPFGKERLEIAMDTVWYKKFESSVLREKRPGLQAKMDLVIPIPKHSEQQADIIRFLEQSRAVLGGAVPTTAAPTEYFETPEARQQYAYEMYFRPHETYLALLKQQFAKLKDALIRSRQQFPSNNLSPELEDAVLTYDNTWKGPIEGNVVDDITKEFSSAEALLQLASTSQISEPSIRKPMLKEVARRADVIGLAMRLLISYDAVVNARMSAMELGLIPEVAKSFDKLRATGSLGLTNLLTGAEAVAVLRPQVEKYEAMVQSEVNKFAELTALGHKIWLAFEIAGFLYSGYQMVRALPTLLRGLTSLGGGPGSTGGGMLALAAGGRVTYTVGAEVRALTLTAEQIAELIATGALPVTAMAMSTGGIAGTGPGPSIPSFETIHGAGPRKRPGGFSLGRGAIVRVGKGGLKERKLLSFTRQPRNVGERGFDSARQRFLKDLAKDPEVRQYFGEGSPELQNMEAGMVPGPEWTVHHNIPATANVPGVNLNDASNFSLLHKWIHEQVSVEWSAVLRKLGKQQSGEWAFPIFDRFVHGKLL